MKKILVTGGAGFIGSNLTKALVEQKNKVVVVDNFSQGSIKNLNNIRGSNLQVINEDILNTEKMKKHCEGVHTVYHLAVQCLRISLNDPMYVDRVNSSGTLSVLWAAYHNKVSKFVYCSSSEVYGNGQTIPMSEAHPLTPTTVYGVSKVNGELYTRCFFHNFSLNTVIIRPFNTYGYNEHYEGMFGEVIPRFVILAKNNIPLTIFGEGSQTRDFTFVTDTVEGIIKASKENRLNGQEVNIAKGEEVSIGEIARIVIKETKSASAINYKPQRPHDVERHYADITKAKKILGFKPKINIQEGIRLYIKHLEDSKFNFKKALQELPEKNW